jgi:uncharacterized RDD family membrane protein YckC
MKCPKCRYLSFEPELRCKHCGYDFSLAESSQPARTFDELEQQDPDIPMVDLQLRSAQIDREPAPPRPLPTPAADMPLFLKRGVADLEVQREDREDDENDEESFLRVPTAPRPLVVRRRSPEPPRQAPAVSSRGAAAIGHGDDLLDYLRRAEPDPTPPALPAAAASLSRFVVPRRVQPRSAPEPMASEPIARAVDAPARLKAAAVDLGILVALNLTVILLTLRQCDLSVTQIARLPVIPMFGFLGSLAIGYLLMFNVVSARTIGKMIFRLHVVADSPEREADLAPTQRQLSYRALLTVPSVLLLGLGFLPGLVGDGLAIHDRLTHTRVVRE